MALVIDLAAPARRLSDEEFAVWAQGQTVFLSSVMGELVDERAAVAGALEPPGFNVRWFEEFGGRDDSASEAYLTEVRSSTIYLGLLGDQYGGMLATGPYAGYSATHAEYLEARANGKRISFWERKSADQREGGARRFSNDIRLFHVTGSFAGPPDLPAKIDARLHEIAADDLSPWVKLGDVIVRARRVRASGGQLTVEARVHDRGVRRALDGLAGGRTWGRGPEMQVTAAERSGRGRVDDLIVETSSGAYDDVAVTLTVDWSGGGEMAVQTGGYSAEDLTEIAVKVGLLGEPMPAALKQMSFLVKADDPFTELQELSVPEDSVQALARLLVVEQFVGARRASAVDAFSLGPANRGERHLEITWREPERYSNVEPQMRTVKGKRRWG